MKRILIACLALCAGALVPGRALALAFQSDIGHHHGGSQKPKPPGGTNPGPGDVIPTGGSRGKGPGDTTPARAGSGQAPTVGSRPAVVPAPPAAPQGPTSPFLPATQAGEASNDSHWWMWWEFNKTEFLRPNRLRVRLGVTTGVETPDEREALLQSKLDLLRLGLRDAFHGELAAADAVERAHATGAFGRMAGPTAVDALVAALADPSLVVRQRAILALGSIASEPAFEALQRIAETGRVHEGVEIAGNARPLAVAALAIGRRAGLDDRADRLVERVTRTRPSGEGDRIAVGAMIYQSVAPCAALEQLAFELARDGKLSMPVRCRALEALARAGTDDAFELVERALAGSGLELRRSAGVALALTGHARASEVGRAALAREVEPVTRGFVALSLGRIGDAKAREALLARLDGDAVDRPWCALGLGLAVRTSGDATALAALRELAANERNADTRPACWVALGLARDAGSVPFLATQLASNTDPLRQHYAATALALVGDGAAHDALVARLGLEKKSMARVSIATALAIFGRPDDVARIVDAASTLREPGLQALADFGLGYHGALEAIGPLAERVSSKTANAATRAGACAALGLLLARHEPLVLAKASHSSNYTVYEAWMDELVQTTL